jgi:hypothetical protein
VKLIALEEHFRAPVLRSRPEKSGFDRAEDPDNPLVERMAKLDDRSFWPLFEAARWPR